MNKMKEDKDIKRLRKDELIEDYSNKFPKM